MRTPKGPAYILESFSEPAGVAETIQPVRAQHEATHQQQHPSLLHFLRQVALAETGQYVSHCEAVAVTLLRRAPQGPASDGAGVGELMGSRAHSQAVPTELAAPEDGTAAAVGGAGAVVLQSPALLLTERRLLVLHGGAAFLAASMPLAGALRCTWLRVR